MLLKGEFAAAQEKFWHLKVLPQEVFLVARTRELCRLIN